MKRISTSNDEWKDYCDAMKKERIPACRAPRRQTMELIMQFSRSYHVERNLPVKLSGIVLN